MFRHDRQAAPRWKPILVAALAAVAVATLGALMTDLGPWYGNLRKPSWQPPDWLFGPVWTLIFGLCALSGYLAWRNAPNRGGRDGVIALFALNGFLNVLWSALFFRLKRPDWALPESGLLWLSILLMIVALPRLLENGRRAAAAVPGMGIFRNDSQLVRRRAERTICGAMTALFTSGRAVDLILAIMAIEAVVLLTYRMATGRGIQPAGLMTNLIAGALLLLALRSALIGSPWIVTAAWLAGALLAHIADLAQRWRSQI